MADVATNPFVALSLCVAWRTTTQFAIFLATSLVFGISVSVDYIYSILCSGISIIRIAYWSGLEI